MDKEPKRWTEAFGRVKAMSLAKKLSVKEMKAPIIISGRVAVSLIAGLKGWDSFRAWSLSKSRFSRA